LLEDDSFQLDTPRLGKVLAVAKKVKEWIQGNTKETENQVVRRIMKCFEGGAS
jgi:hypothetical protein